MLNKTIKLKEMKILTSLLFILNLIFVALWIGKIIKHEDFNTVQVFSFSLNVIAASALLTILTKSK